MEVWGLERRDVAGCMLGVSCGGWGPLCHWYPPVGGQPPKAAESSKCLGTSKHQPGGFISSLWNSFQRQLQSGPQKIRSEFCVMIKILTRAAFCIRQSLVLRTIECIDLVSQGLKREPQKPFWPPLRSMVISFSTSGEVALRGHGHT